AVARSEHLLGHCRRRDQAADLGLTADATPPAADLDAFAARQPRVERRRRRGEHDAAGTIEVAGEDVHQVATPRRQGPEFLYAVPGAAVARGRSGPRELAREATDDIGRNAAGFRDAFGGEVPRHRLDLVEAADEPRGGAQTHQTLGKESVHQSEKEG